MSYTVNELFAATAHLMLPFVLMDAPENMDFVKDATCVLFIAQLDTLQVVAPDHEIPLEEEELPRLVQDEIPGQEEKELPLLEVEIPMPGRVMKKREKRRRAQGATTRASRKRSFSVKRRQLNQFNRGHCQKTRQIRSFQHQFDA